MTSDARDIVIIRQIGVRIRECRKARRETAEQLSSTLRISGGTLTNMETGKTAPSIGLLLRLARHFHLDVRSFFSDEPPPVGTAAKAFVRDFAHHLEDEDWRILQGLARALLNARRRS